MSESREQTIRQESIAAPSGGRLMTAERLAGLIEAGETAAVLAALEQVPDLLHSTVERDHLAGWSPLHLALRHGRRELVAALIRAGADLSARTEHGRTPLHVCLQYSRMLRGALLDAGAEVDTAVAAYFDEAELLREHLDRDRAALNDDRTGMPPLRWAAYGAADTTTRLLIERGADLDGALHAAAEVNAVEVAQLLLEAGADPSEADPHTGETPLHAAAKHLSRPDNTAVARMLLEAGADVDAVSSDGVSALDVARIGAARQSAEQVEQPAAHAAMTVLLREYGARD